MLLDQPIKYLESGAKKELRGGTIKSKLARVLKGRV
jgi:hypothetical protein